MESILRDMKQRAYKVCSRSFRYKLQENHLKNYPNKEELELHMQLSYKQAVEIAEEQAITTVLDGNKI